ncbi:ER membrane protein complex subunit 8/9-like protein [Frankliniella fusca]|uniref:ER membrane protein complex subunit 8/9-like protein n=1 Tax=Frankliniella fusca TaxID=407009 RepID=A0AAE1HZJ1_9NEOP|nr:ER membrane protein complex subunit 8/9-like protein [Frankliniella fusca]
MTEVSLSARAYCKMILHAAKYPHCAVNGLLLGRINKERDELVVMDAVPLFHICLQVSPMAEIALTQVDQVAANSDLTIAGYYVANENISDVSVDRAANRIADKIAENFPPACFIVLDNQHLTLSMETPGITLSQFNDGKWRPKDVKLSNDVLDTTAALLEQRAFKMLVDFDNHLDDVSQDWKNKELNQAIDDAAGLA